MDRHPQQIKRERQDKKKHILNVAKSSEMKTIIKSTLEESDISKAQILYKKAVSTIDKMVNKLSFILIGKLKKKANISRIMIHSSSSIESAISMLTCTKLGIFFCVIYKDLETEAINKRISIFKPDLILSSVQKKLTNIKLSKNKIL